MTTDGSPMPYVTTPQGVQPQIVTVQPGMTTVAAMYQRQLGNWKGMTGTGIIQIVAGGLTLILGIVGLVIDKYKIKYTIGYPLWCGLLFYVVAGALGMAAGLGKKRAVAIGYMVTSTLACAASCVVIGFSGNFLYYYSEYCPDYDLYCSSADVAVDALLLVFGIVEFVTSITGASMTCRPVYNAEPTTPTLAYQAQPMMAIGGQPQFVHQPQQLTQYPEAQAPPTGENHQQPLIK